MKTHCRRGHELTADNIHTTPSGRRRCRECFLQYKVEGIERRRNRRNVQKRSNINNEGMAAFSRMPVLSP